MKNINIFKSLNKENSTYRKVYISCHKNDYAKLFTKIVDDILSIRKDFNIYYLNDFEYYPYSDEDLQNYLANLSSINLFVFLISYDFLMTDNISFDIDFQFAIKNHYQIMPIFVQRDLHSLFNDKCGSIQALDRASEENLVSYNEKLKKFIDSFCISLDSFQSIKNAFDAYIFLSYRKQDKKYAQSIMSLIHKNEFMRDVAIWYDENLTLGTNFNEEIKAIIHKSDVISFVVTPNLYKPNQYNDNNYVVSVEYPEAMKNKKTLLPIESVYTDKHVLKQYFENFPEVINANDEVILATKLKDLLFKEGIKENKDPEHLYFIGLAYLYAIDVERNIDRAIVLLKQSSESNYIPAIMELVKIYRDGIGVARDLDKAIELQANIIELTDDNNELVNAMLVFANLLELTSDYERALNCYESCYEFLIENNGKKDRQTLSILNKLLDTKIKLNNYDISSIDKCYQCCLEEFGEEDQLTLTAMESCALVYSLSNKLRESIDMYRKIYEIKNRLYGKNLDTIAIYKKLAFVNSKYGSHSEAIKISEEILKFYIDIYGSEDDDTINSLFELSTIYEAAKEYSIAIEKFNEYYSLSVNKYGEFHPTTIKILDKLADIYYSNRDFTKAIDALEKLYDKSIYIYNYYHESVYSTVYKLSNVLAMYSLYLLVRFHFIKCIKFNLKSFRVLTEYVSGKKLSKMPL